MSLNLQDKPVTAASGYCTSKEFTEAVNDSQFVRTFGFVSLAGSVLTILSGAVAIGVGMAVTGFGNTRYYRALGLTVILVAVAGVLFPAMSLIAPIILSGGVAWKGWEIIGILTAEGKGDPDWQVTRSRALTGMAAAGVGLLISGAWLIWFTIVPFIQGS
jgi:hypothetical protein